MSDDAARAIAAAAAAATATANADADNRIKRRKRKDPPASAPTGSGAAPLQPVRSAAGSPGSSVRTGVPSSTAATATVTLDSFLVPLSAQQQSQVQSAVLGVIFPGRSNHAPHLYRSLPGPLPISITRSHLQELQQHDYWACEKSDGERAMLYVSRERQAAYLLDRKFVVRQIRHSVYSELWGAQGDTLLDGELVMSAQPVATNQPLAHFMAFDALMINGTRTLNWKLSQRIEQLKLHVEKPFEAKFPPQPSAPAQPTTFAEMIAAEAAVAGTTATTPAAAAATVTVPYPPISVGAKSFEKKQDLQRIFTKIHDLGGGEYEYRDEDKQRRNKNVGVIFTPQDDDYFCRRVPLLKWKWRELNTIDFLTRAPWFDAEGKLMLYATASVLSEGGRSGGGSGPTATVHMRSTQLTPEKRDFFLRSVAGKDQAIAEMQYDPSSSSWQPKNFRWDKSSPNFMTTVVATLETIIDDVQPDDLI